MNTEAVARKLEETNVEKFKFDTRKYAMFIALIVIALLFQI